MSRAIDLPDDIEALKRLVMEQRAALLNRDLLIEKLKIQLARSQRQRFGRSSEALDAEIAQLSLTIEELETSQATLAALTPLAAEPASEPRKPARRPLPESLPRESIVHEAPCQCPGCGGALRPAGEDASEMIEWVPSHLKVIRHVRPKYACDRCEKIVQAPAPSRPIARGLAGPGLLAHVLVSKYVDHLPLYRQCQMYARDGIELERSTLADWVGGAHALIAPLTEALGRYVMRAEKLHADDTPVPVLCPGRKSTRQGRLWTYVRDDRPAGSPEPPAAWYQYSPDRKGEHPRAHLAPFAGILQADGYAGFARLYGEKIQEAACWAHVRRKFYDVHAETDSPIAAEALARIGRLYAVEAEIRGRPPPKRQAQREARAGPELAALHTWLNATLPQLSKKSELAVAIRYALTRWVALTRYCHDGRIEIDNNAAERSLRAVALGRKNWLFAGSDDGGERAAAIYSLLGTAQLNGLNAESYLRHVLERLPEHPINRIEELLPWAVAETMPEIKLAA